MGGGKEREAREKGRSEGGRLLEERGRRGQEGREERREGRVFLTEIESSCVCDPSS